ncbi:MAG: hypothetical protein FWE80_09455, partial [Oscillospiraceae bacterium]|nr:hypothetical protein [Oscillospiraceae bacterium]
EIHTVDGVERIFNGSDFHNKQVIYPDATGNLTDMGKTYAGLVMEAAVESKVSPYHLASRIRQESLGNLSYTSVCGTAEGFEGIYNFYNIGATAALDPTVNGLTFAKGKNWTDPAKAIIGGAVWIGSGYINSGQNTIYLEKFDVDDSDGILYWHQYMTYIMTPVVEQSKIYNAYKEMGMLECPLNFIIPVYENMPEDPAPIPDSDWRNYRNVDEKTMVYLHANPAFRDIVKALFPEEETTATQTETSVETQPVTRPVTEPPVSTDPPPDESERIWRRYIWVIPLVLVVCAAGVIAYIYKRRR